MKSTVKYASQLPDHNIVSQAVSRIRNNQTVVVFQELQNIRGIGPKLASLFLRDVCFIFRIEPADKPSLICLQPVDTWVRQVAVKLGIPSCTQTSTVNDVVEPIVDFCIAKRISPLLFNAGAWYVGARSFDLLLEKL